MKLSMSKIQGNFTPTTTDDHDKFNKLKDGYYVVSINQIRCPVRHREFFGVLKMVFENLKEGSDCRDESELLDMVKSEMLLRSYKKGISECPAGRINSKGKAVFKSLSFENMDQDTFDQFTTSAYQVLASWVYMEVYDLLEWYKNR